MNEFYIIAMHCQGFGIERDKDGNLSAVQNVELAFDAIPIRPEMGLYLELSSHGGFDPVALYSAFEGKKRVKIVIEEDDSSEFGPDAMLESQKKLDEANVMLSIKPDNR